MKKILKKQKSIKTKKIAKAKKAVVVKKATKPTSEKTGLALTKFGRISISLKLQKELGIEKYAGYAVALPPKPELLKKRILGIKFFKSATNQNAITEYGKIKFLYASAIIKKLTNKDEIKAGHLEIVKRNKDIIFVKIA